MKSKLQAPPPPTPPLPPKPPQSSAAIFSEEPITVLRISDYSILSKWTIRNFTRMKLKSILSTPFELIRSLNCRIALFSKSDSIYLQLGHPLGTEFDCLICFNISILNTLNVSKSMSTISFYRFTDKNRSYGWNDIGLSSTVVDPKLGFISNTDDTLTITADIRILKESTSFTPDNNESSFNCEKFTWTVRNFGLLVELIKNRTLMSPSFIAEDCILWISIHRSVIDDVDYLSLFLESEKKTKKSNWCLFRMSAVNQNSSHESIHRDSHGRIGETKRIGWIDFVEFSRFIEPNKGFLVHDHDDDDDNTAVFSVSFLVIKESIEDLKKFLLPHKPDLYPNRYIWKIENFTRLKDRLKMWNIKGGLAVQSPMIKIGDQDLRLVIYPQGKSQPSDNLSFYLEVMERPDESSDWSYYISFRLSVMNQKNLDKSVSMDWGEGEKRESNTTKELGWSEFMLLNNLFDQDSGYLVGDSINFFAEVILLEETFVKGKRELENAGYTVHEMFAEDELFVWRMHNFLSFKNILETNQNILETIRIIVSQTFQVGECRLQIGVSQYSDFIIAILECYPPVTNDTVFEVRFQMSLLNQGNRDSFSHQATASTKKRCFMKFMKVSDLLDQDAGFLHDESVIFWCRILHHGPKTESSEAEFKLKLEMDRSAKEMKDLERELERFQSERNEEITQLSVEREDYKNRFHNLERRFSQLKSRSSDCFQRLQKKKNDLAERLEIAESSRQRSDDKLKIYAEKNEVQENVMHSLQDEIRQLKVTVERLEREKLDKDKRISQLETDINGMEANFSACQRLEEEKNDLAERLKTEESARKISDDKLKCYAIDILAQKNDIRQLKVTVEQLGQEKLIKEGRIKQLETENDGIKKKFVNCQSLHVDLSKETLVRTQQLELEEMHTELRKDTVIVDHRANHGTFPNSSQFGPIAPPSRSTGQLAASVSRHGSPAQYRAITPPSSRTTSASLHGNPAYYRAITSPSLSSRSTEQSASVNLVHNIEHVTREGAPPWHDQT